MLLNFTFPWDKNFLNNIKAVEGPAILMIMMRIYGGYNGGCHQEDETRESRDIMVVAIKKMKQGKAGGFSGVRGNRTYV